ncbi:MAG: DEAD/DEAH box helicase [Nonlabens sp.]|nr:DEAD/DEAH box helicase [Nonlabens sp.]
MTFDSLGLSASFLAKLSSSGLQSATAIQQKSIPAILEGKDVMAVAPTGSGKTIGYALPLLQRLEGTKSKNRFISALILVPTRELAMQVNEVVVTYSKALPSPLIAMAVYGGVSINPQMKKMNGVDVLVATPGRLIELLDSNALQLAEVSTLVLDEADKMLSMGFKEEVDNILSRLPIKRQTLLFSATLDKEVKTMQEKLLENPVTIIIERETPEELDLIKQEAFRVTQEKKGLLLRHLITSRDLRQVLIFCSSTYQVEHVNDKLNINGITSKAIHSKKSQGARKQNLADFKNGAETGVRCLVTTDLLARGIDIAFLPTVINYELPRSPLDFTHRIGRTGRAENPGTAITLVTADEAHHWRVIQKKIGKKVWTEDLPEWNS